MSSKSWLIWSNFPHSCHLPVATGWWFTLCSSRWTVVFITETSGSTRKPQSFESSHNRCSKCWEIHIVESPPWQKGVYTLLLNVDICPVSGCLAGIGYFPKGVCRVQESPHHPEPSPGCLNRGWHTDSKITSLLLIRMLIKCLDLMHSCFADFTRHSWSYYGI